MKIPSRTFIISAALIVVGLFSFMQHVSILPILGVIMILAGSVGIISIIWASVIRMSRGNIIPAEVQTATAKSTTGPKMSRDRAQELVNAMSRILTDKEREMVQKINQLPCFIGLDNPCISINIDNDQIVFYLKNREDALQLRRVLYKNPAFQDNDTTKEEEITYHALPISNILQKNMLIIPKQYRLFVLQWMYNLPKPMTEREYTIMQKINSLDCFKALEKPPCTRITIDDERVTIHIDTVVNRELLYNVLFELLDENKSVQTLGFHDDATDECAGKFYMNLTAKAEGNFIINWIESLEPSKPILGSENDS